MARAWWRRARARSSRSQATCAGLRISFVDRMTKWTPPRSSDVQPGGPLAGTPNSDQVRGAPAPRRSASWLPSAGTTGAIAPIGAVISKYFCQFDSSLPTSVRSPVLTISAGASRTSASTIVRCAACPG